MPQSKKRPKSPPDSDADKTTLELIAEVVPNHQEWLNTPNSHMGLRTPRQILDDGTYEPALRNLILGYKAGNFA